MQRLVCCFVLTLGIVASLSKGQGIYWTEFDSWELRAADLEGSNPRTLIENPVPGRQIAIDPGAGHLYWFNRYTIVRSSLNGTGAVELVTLTPNQMPTGDFAIHLPNQKMYWVRESLYHANLDGSGLGILISVPPENLPAGMGIDSVRGKIYWAEELTHRIQRANLNGSAVETFRAGLGAVKDVAVNPANGAVYWTEAIPGRICRADFDGSNEIIVKSGLDFPIHLLLDPTAAKLYWSEHGAGPGSDVRRCNLDGSNVEPVRLNVVEGVGSFDVNPADGHLYTATAIEENVTTAIERCNLNGSSLVTLITPKFFQPFNLAFHAGTSRLIYLGGSFDTIKLLEVDPYNTATLTSTPTFPHVAGLAVSAATGTTYLGDAIDCDSASPDSRIIRRAPGGSWQAIVSGLECPYGIAVDDNGGKLYWTDSRQGIIQRSSLDGSGKETLIAYGRSPVSIAVDSVGGKMYWTDWSGFFIPSDSDISRANLDGTGQQVLVTGLPTVYGLALDVTHDQMYWTTKTSIMKSNMDGSNVETIVSGLSGAWGIAVDVCMPSECGGKKNRFLSYDAAEASAAAGEPIAIRVKLVDLPRFPASNGQMFWLGASTPVQDTPGNEAFNVARLQCGPLVQDWSAAGVIHMHGAEIVPDSTYEIRYANAACVALGEESCMSAPVILQTGHWGDIRYPFFSGQGATEPSFLDITAVVDKFRELPGAPSRLRAKLYGSVPDPTTPVNFLDIGSMVDAFRGMPYNFTGPGNCP